MNKYLIIILIIPSILVAQEFFSLKKTKSDYIKVDGILSQGEWSNARIIPLDIEIEPANNKPSEKKTLAYVTYSDDAILIGFYAYDDPKKIRASIHARDSRNFWRDDVINVRLDTFGDSRNNYLLAVNPLGSQFDLVQSNTSGKGGYNSNYNINFQSSGNIVSDGYQVEIRIPFSELPFPNTNDQTWNIRFHRQYMNGGIRVETSSQELDRDNGCRVCQTTDIIEMKDIKIEKRREVLPYYFSSLSAVKRTPSGKMESDKIYSRLGVGINFDLSKTTSFEASINPDFSQVEADVTLIDINSPVSLRYPERRPFFNRGMDIVNFKQDVFYSRSISSPQFASKILYQGKNSRFFMLTAMDLNTRYLIGGEDKSVSTNLSKSYSGLFRYQMVSKKTRFGLLSSNRVYENEGYGTLFGLDGQIDLSSVWRFGFEVFKNYNAEPISDVIDDQAVRYGRSLKLDGEKFEGHSMQINISRISEHFTNFLYYREVSPNHQSDLGIITRNNRRFISCTNRYNKIIDFDFIREFGFAIDSDFVKNFNDELNLISLNFKGNISISGNTSVDYNYDLDAFKNFLGYDFKNIGIHELEIRSSPTELINFSGSLSWGKDLSYNESIPEVGNLFSSLFKIRLQLNNNFSITPSIRTSSLKKPEDGSDFFSGSIIRLRSTYQFNNFLNIRIISEHNTFRDKFFVQPLIQWVPNPSTIFYLGGNQQTQAFEDEEFSRPELFDFNRIQFFLKFQYLIGI